MIVLNLLYVCILIIKAMNPTNSPIFIAFEIYKYSYSCNVTDITYNTINTIIVNTTSFLDIFSDFMIFISSLVRQMDIWKGITIFLIVVILKKLRTKTYKTKIHIYTIQTMTKKSPYFTIKLPFWHNLPM